MKGKSSLRLHGVLLIVVLTAVCLTGCGRKQVVYGGDVASNTDGMDDMLPLKDTLAVEDSWEEIIDVGTDNIHSISIKADVTVPDTDSLKVISTERKIIDENYKKRVIESLCDGTVYMYDSEHIPKSEWKKTINDIEELIYIDQKNGVEQEIIDSEMETLAYYQEMYEQAPDDYVAAEDYTADIYMLKYRDREYKLQFVRNDSGYGGIDFYPLNYEEFLDEEEQGEYSDIRLYESTFLYGSTDNKCHMSIGDAESEAKEFFSVFDATGFKAVDAYALKWDGTIVNEGGEDSESKVNYWYDGCVLTMYRNIDGVNVDGDKYENVAAFWVSDGDDYSYRLERIEVRLNDDGVLGFYWEYPLESGNVTTDNVQLLPYEKIKDALREAAIEHSVNWGTSKTVKYNTLELLYYRCKESDNSDNYSIIPVWRLSNVEDGDINRFVMVNAIDGSYVDVRADVY